MKPRVASVGTNYEGLAFGSVCGAHSRVDVRCGRGLFEEPRIEPVAADNKAEAFREVGIRRCAAGDEAQAADAWRIGQSSDRVQCRDAVREQSFARLAGVKNRAHEPWVLESLRYLNHPLRETQSQKFLRPALDLLPEIQRTGDIFFPKRWSDAVLSNQRSP